MKEITSQTFDSNINGDICVLDFFAPWCQPCALMSPLLEDVEHETGVPVFKINVDDSPELAKRFRISNLPSLVVYHGEAKEKLVGLKSKSEIISAVESFKE